MKKSSAIVAIIFSLAWTTLINNLVVHVLGDTLSNQILGLVCGISLGICIGIGAALLIEKSKFK